MEHKSNKTPLIIGLSMFAIVIVLVILSGKLSRKEPEPVPTIDATPEPTAPVPPSPHTPEKDYTDDSFTFTDEMGDVVLSHNSYFYNQDITLKIYSR